MERAAWAERIRHTPKGGVGPFEVRRRVGRARVDGLLVLDLTDEGTCRTLGVRRGRFGGDDYTACQELADRARAAGFEGILAPSAALDGGFTVVVFPHALFRLTEEHSRIQRPPRTMRRFLRRIPRVRPSE